MMSRVALALVVLGGCFGWPPPPPEGPEVAIRKLADGKVQSLDVNLKDAEGVCPGEPTKLYAKGMVQWPGQKPVMRTIGNDVDSFAPSSFQVQGPLIRGDEHAHMHPSGDVLASIESGFEATVTYTPEPQRFTWKKVMRPVYTCFGSYSVAGAEGAAGGGGRDGTSGDTGISGGPADPGQRGGRGSDAGSVTAFVTVVATPWYPKLYAVIANDQFYLVHPDRELWFVASGGPGGPGGQGGRGGNGGWQAYEEKEVPEDGEMVMRKLGIGVAGNGGNGGNGGGGGDGGNGGSIDITYDSRFPELASWIKTDVRGGAGGPPGDGGAGGDGGGSEADRSPHQGNPGNPGNPGSANGRDGRSGRASVRQGNVSARFASLRGLAIAGTAQAQSITTKASLPPISDAGSSRRSPAPAPAPAPGPVPAPRPRKGGPR